MSWLFASSGQSIGAWSSASVLPMNIRGWFPLGLTGLISLLSKELSRVFSSIVIWTHQFFAAQSSLWSNSHIHTWLLEKPWLWLYGPLSTKWCLCFLIKPNYIFLSTLSKRCHAASSLGKLTVWYMAFRIYVAQQALSWQCEVPPGPSMTVTSS